MAEQINTSTTLTDYRQTTTLEGRDYIFRFLFNQREGLWTFSLLDEEGDPIVEGLKVVVNVPLLRLVVDTRTPPGALIAFDTQTVLTEAGEASSKQLSEDPGQADLGERVLLVYFTAAEVAAAQAA